MLTNGQSFSKKAVRKQNSHWSSTQNNDGFAKSDTKILYRME